MMTAEHRKAALLISIMPVAQCDCLLATLDEVDRTLLVQGIAHVRAQGWDDPDLVEQALHGQSSPAAQTIPVELEELLALALEIEASLFARIISARNMQPTAGSQDDFIFSLLPKSYAAEVKRNLQNVPSLAPATGAALLRALVRPVREIVS